MSTIPTEMSRKQFEKQILPHLTTAKRGFVCKIPLHKVFNYILYWLHTGCQWKQLPIDPDPADPEKKEISYHAVYYHYRKWSRDGSLKKVWCSTIQAVEPDLNLSELNLDGTHTLAKKGGQSVAYQGRKKAKTSNILPFMDGHGYIIGSTGIIAGNHNDAFKLKSHLQTAFKTIKKLGLDIAGAFFNADSAFDTKAARKTCFNHGLVPNIPENKRNRKSSKRGRKRLFNADVYKRRFTAERSFAWVDKFKRLLIRFERKDVYWLGGHYVAFAMINLRHILA
jgi:transposase